MSTVSIIDKYLRIDGTLISNSRIDFLGFINGDVFVNELVIKGEGTIKGSLYSTNNVVIESGVIEGNMIANSLKLASNAKIYGNLKYVNLVVESGAEILGSVERIKEDELKQLINTALTNVKSIENENK
jgi:cytoskeletal protein CcmA (bactofilin family)